MVGLLREVATIKKVPVICYGLRTDFRSKLFDGSKRLLELADCIEEIKVMVMATPTALSLRIPCMMRIDLEAWPYDSKQDHAYPPARTKRTRRTRTIRPIASSTDHSHRSHHPPSRQPAPTATRRPSSVSHRCTRVDHTWTPAPPRPAPAPTRAYASAYSRRRARRQRRISRKTPGIDTWRPDLKHVDGQPTLSGEQITLGAEELYLPVCPFCYMAKLNLLGRGGRRFSQLEQK